MPSPFEKAVPRAADPTTHRPRSEQTSWREADDRLERRERAAARAKARAGGPR